MNLWDTAGEETYHSLQHGFFRDSDGGAAGGCVAARDAHHPTRAVFIVYDALRAASFAAIDKWASDIEAHCPGAVLVLLGNKVDVPSGRAVSREEGEAAAARHGALHFEVSAKSGANVEAAFVAMMAALLARER